MRQRDDQIRWAWWLSGVALLVVFWFKPTAVIELVEALARLATGAALLLLLWRSGTEVQQFLGRLAKGDRFKTPAGEYGFAKDLTEAELMGKRLSAEPDSAPAEEVSHGQ
ncbi:MAG: hypothetical protein HUU35_03795 [Armatimonadetes bacterium]|nr:hypothetical protein [Armatimonadota bacterium]